MRITEITVSAGRVVSHPTESYANLRPQVTLKASLDDSDDPIAATKELQAKAEQLVEDHKNQLVDDIMKLERLSREDAEIAGLEQRLREAQSRLEALRSSRKLLTGNNGHSEAIPEDELAF